VQTSRGLISVKFPKSMLQLVRGAQRRYQEALECKQKDATEEDKKAARRITTEEITRFVGKESDKLDRKITQKEKLKMT